MSDDNSVQSNLSTVHEDASAMSSTVAASDASTNEDDDEESGMSSTDSTNTSDEDERGFVEEFRFDEELNITTEVWDRDEDQGWNEERQYAIVRAASRNLRVQKLVVDPCFLREDELNFLAELLQTTQTVNELVFDVDENFVRQRKVDRLLNAAASNSYMPLRKLSTNFLASAESFRVFFSAHSETLEHFEWDYNAWFPSLTYECEIAIARGLAATSSLKSLSLQCGGMDDNTDDSIYSVTFILSGLVTHPNLESLSLTIDVYQPIVHELRKLIVFTNRLRCLTVRNTRDDGTYERNDIARIFSGIHHNTSLKTITFDSFVLDDPGPDFLSHSNTTVKELAFENCSFNDFSFRNFFPFCGLKTLLLKECSLQSLHEPEGWEHIFLGNAGLESMICTSHQGAPNEVIDAMAVGLRNHRTLKLLSLAIDDDREDCPAIRSLIQSCSSVSTLKLYNVKRPSTFSHAGNGLAQNDSLVHLFLYGSRSSVRSFDASVLFRGCRQHPTLQTLEIMSGIGGLSSDRELELMLQNNTVLSSLFLACDGELSIDICTSLARGMGRNTTLRKLCLHGSSLPPGGLSTLGNLLEYESNLENLSICSSDVPFRQDVISFLQSLQQAPRLKSLSLPMMVDDAEIAESVSQMIQQNKILFSFLGLTFGSEYQSIKDKVDFYLKLNRCGRRLLRSPNVPKGLWPEILARITKPSDADVLFYFIKTMPDLACNEEGSGNKRRRE